MSKYYVRYVRVNRNGTTVPVVKVFRNICKANLFAIEKKGIVLLNK